MKYKSPNPNKQHVSEIPHSRIVLGHRLLLLHIHESVHVALNMCRNKTY